MNTSVCPNASITVKWLLPEEYRKQALILNENCHRRALPYWLLISPRQKSDTVAEGRRQCY